jgi:hypothetical protein
MASAPVVVAGGVRRNADNLAARCWIPELLNELSDRSRHQSRSPSRIAGDCGDRCRIGCRNLDGGGPPFTFPFRIWSSSFWPMPRLGRRGSSRPALRCGSSLGQKLLANSGLNASPLRGQGRLTQTTDVSRAKPGKSRSVASLPGVEIANTSLMMSVSRRLGDSMAPPPDQVTLMNELRA